MKKIILFLFYFAFFNSVIAQTQNQTIATGISAESFNFTTPTDSLNFLTATRKVNGVGVWRKVNLGQIKTWINNENVINGIKDYGTELNLQNNFENSKVKIESSNGQYNIVELSTGNIKFRVNKFTKSFDFWDESGYFTLRSGDIAPIPSGSDKRGDLYIERTLTGGLWQYVNGAWSKIVGSQDMSGYLTTSQAANIYETKVNSDYNINYANSERARQDSILESNKLSKAGGNIGNSTFDVLSTNYNVAKFTAPSAHLRVISDNGAAAAVVVQNGDCWVQMRQGGVNDLGLFGVSQISRKNMSVIQTASETNGLVFNLQGQNTKAMFFLPRNNSALGTATELAMTIKKDTLDVHDSRVINVRKATEGSDAIPYAQADSLCNSKVAFQNLSAVTGSTILDAEGKSTKTFRVAVNANGTYSFSIANPISGATYKIKFYGSATSANVNFVNFADTAQNSVVYANLNLSGNSVQNLSVTYDAQTEKYYLN